jgi:ADP-heptose:LPS heptosyltransferase
VVNKILIIALTRMGDLLQSSPTIIGLKNQYPNAEITIVVDKQFSSICKGIPGIDDVYVMDMGFLARGINEGGEGLVMAYEYVCKLVDDLRAYSFDMCLNMSNSAYTALLIKLLNIKTNTGWLSDDEGFRVMADPWAMLFSAFVYHSNRDYNELNLVDIFRCAAKVTKHPHKLCYEPSKESYNKIDDFLSKTFKSESGPLIAIQVGASQEKRQWAAKKFALLTRYLIEDLNARILYTGAPSETNIIEAVQAEYSHPQAVSIAGRTSIDELGAVLDRTDLLITGDTGPMHLSVAVGTPVVAVFLASALCYETGPYSAGNIVVQPQISCNPCNPNYSCLRPDCHDLVSPELVTYLAKLRLKTPLSDDENLSIPVSIASPSEARIFRTTFDTDGFLKFIPINGEAAEKGNPTGFLDACRAAYRDIWKEELMGVASRRVKINNSTNYLSEICNPVVELCARGVKALETLKKLAMVGGGVPGELEAVEAELALVDENLEKHSLTFPILGALVRIFIMEKENMRGKDLIELSNKTQIYYGDLERRVKKFKDYFNIYFGQAKEEEYKLGESHVASIC